MADPTITNGYATLAEFKRMKKISSTDANDDEVIADCIEAASRYIDNDCGRTFYARTETRYYDVPERRDKLLLLDDELLTITTLTNGDGTVITSSYYNLVPKNIPPYYGIKLKKPSNYFWECDSYGDSESVISVAGTWGYSTTAPHDIRQACLEIANGMYMRRKGEYSSAAATVTGAGVVITPKDIPAGAAAILAKYRRLI